MPPKRKLAEGDAATAVPPSLPPSVEEAYRRKCVQLKNRTHEVEDANDAAGLRLARTKRQVEKLRIERAFLLEQLARRTSTNVEDSEGSPSPPPTPKDKPLRIKRGHRKSAANDADSKAGGKDAASPASETQSHAAKGGKAAAAEANGLSRPSRKPASAFELYCAEAQPALEAKNKDGDVNVDEELARGWDELPEAERDDFRTRFEAQAAKRQDAKDAGDSPTQRERKSAAGDGKQAEAPDEDVEMVNYDTDDQETQMDKDGDD